MHFFCCKITVFLGEIRKTVRTLHQSRNGMRISPNSPASGKRGAGPRIGVAGSPGAGVARLGGAGALGGCVAVWPARWGRHIAARFASGGWGGAPTVCFFLSKHACFCPFQPAVRSVMFHFQRTLAGEKHLVIPTTSSWNFPSGPELVEMRVFLGRWVGGGHLQCGGPAKIRPSKKNWKHFPKKFWRSALKTFQVKRGLHVCRDTLALAENRKPCHFPRSLVAHAVNCQMDHPPPRDPNRTAMRG